MTKKNNSFHEKSSNMLSNLLKDLFGNGDPFSDLKREYKAIPLKKKGDIEYEAQWHTSDFEN